jgi:hypothetical protein
MESLDSLRGPLKGLAFLADNTPPPCKKPGTRDVYPLGKGGGGGERSQRFGSGRSWTPENQLPGGSRLSFLSQQAACPAAGTAPTRRDLLLARRGLRLNPTGPRTRETPGSLVWPLRKLNLARAATQNRGARIDPQTAPGSPGQRV